MDRVKGDVQFQSGGRAVKAENGMFISLFKVSTLEYKTGVEPVLFQQLAWYWVDIPPSSRKKNYSIH